jgi:hypothetical protein
MQATGNQPWAVEKLTGDPGLANEKDLREARSRFGIEVLRPGDVLRRLKP